jgi:hypothetical protein
VCEQFHGDIWRHFIEVVVCFCKAVWLVGSSFVLLVKTRSVLSFYKHMSLLLHWSLVRPHMILPIPTLLLFFACFVHPAFEVSYLDDWWSSIFCGSLLWIQMVDSLGFMVGILHIILAIELICMTVTFSSLYDILKRCTFDLRSQVTQLLWLCVQFLVLQEYILHK